mmetsp:Transcript_10545/g.13221  ORF Transcript_10545/g.13221 Transcript_10545/m.13221 type:complete len:90 (+) Transcript_10545:294-563(+)
MENNRGPDWVLPVSLFRIPTTVHGSKSVYAAAKAEENKHSCYGVHMIRTHKTFSDWRWILEDRLSKKKTHKMYQRIALKGWKPFQHVRD